MTLPAVRSAADSRQQSIDPPPALELSSKPAARRCHYRLPGQTDRRTDERQTDGHRTFTQTLAARSEQRQQPKSVVNLELSYMYWGKLY